jgi:hypothetical protein
LRPQLIHRVETVPGTDTIEIVPDPQVVDTV